MNLERTHGAAFVSKAEGCKHDTTLISSCAAKVTAQINSLKISFQMRRLFWAKQTCCLLGIKGPPEAVNIGGKHHTIRGPM